MVERQKTETERPQEKDDADQQKNVTARDNNQQSTKITEEQNNQNSTNLKERTRCIERSMLFSTAVVGLFTLGLFIVGLMQNGPSSIASALI